MLKIFFPNLSSIGMLLIFRTGYWLSHHTHFEKHSRPCCYL